MAGRTSEEEDLVIPWDAFVENEPIELGQLPEPWFWVKDMDGLPSVQAELYEPRVTLHIYAGEEPPEGTLSTCIEIHGPPPTKKRPGAALQGPTVWLREHDHKFFVSRIPVIVYLQLQEAIEKRFQARHQS